MSIETIKVGLEDRSYPISIGSGILARIGTFCAEAGLGNTVALISNPTVASYYRRTVEDSLRMAGFSVTYIEMPDGEEFKSSSTLQLLYDGLVDANLDRGAFIVALGGGVVGDISGYTAATYLRGIPFVQLPTTLLAQVDSSVGGKTGINHPRGKNLIGAFYQPQQVIIDTATLDTLPEREYTSGLAEALKYGISLDEDLFNYFESHVEELLSRDKQCLQHVIRISCQTKARIVEQDEREGGLRAVLNYGHTLGHAVESLTGYKQYLHGEAVAIGMAQIARLSEARGYAVPKETGRILQLIEKLGLPTALPEFRLDEYLEALLHDKKKQDNGIRFVFNKGIGDFRFEKVTDLKGLLQCCGVME
jgi:3-dehydroquinate synthase